MREKMIFFSMHPPTNNLPEAGQKLAYSRLLDFSKKYDVHLFFFCNKKDLTNLKKEDYDFCSSIYIREVSFLDKLKWILFYFWKPFQVAARLDEDLYKRIEAIAREESPSLIHIEYEQGAEIIRKNRLNGLYVSIVLHDVISQSYFRLYKSRGMFDLIRYYYKLQFILVSNWERKTLSKANELVVLNKKDAKLISDSIELNNDSSPKIRIDYPKVSDIFHLANNSGGDGRSIIFWGAMNRFENEDAVFYFVKNVFSKLILKRPEMVLYVVGANPSEKLKSLSSSNVIVTGFVEDPIYFFKKCSLSVAPLRFGAGIKLKVLESLAANLPVLGTSVAGEGIEDVANLVIEDDLNKWPDLIERLISDNRKK